MNFKEYQQVAIIPITPHLKAWLPWASGGEKEVFSGIEGPFVCIACGYSDTLYSCDRETRMQECSGYKGRKYAMATPDQRSTSVMDDDPFEFMAMKFLVLVPIGWESMWVDEDDIVWSEEDAKSLLATKIERVTAQMARAEKEAKEDTPS